MQTLIVLLAVPLLAVALVLALRREGRYAARRRAARARAAQFARVTVSLRQLGVAMRDLEPAAARAGAAMRGFADALHGVHRTAARPSHRAPRGAR